MSDSVDFRDGVHVLNDVPLTIRRRMFWGDSDAAQIGYTSKFVDYAIEASEVWWEAVLGQHWLGLRHQGLGSPMVGMSFDFTKAIYPGERCDLSVHVEKLGRSSLSLRIDGARVDGEHAFTARLTTALTKYDTMRSTPFPDDWRGRIDAYVQECGFRAGGVKGPAEIIDFWFGPDGTRDRFQNRLVWWGRDEYTDPATFDAEIRDNFLRTYEAAADGALDHWQDTAEGALALLLVLDQFPRNMFRNTGRTYAADAKALAVAERAIANGFDRVFPGSAPRFFYLPYEHSEDMDDQRRSVALFESLPDEPANKTAIEYAHRHLAVVERFGRYPHRNEMLGRESTPEELEFLASPAAPF